MHVVVLDARGSALFGTIALLSEVMRCIFTPPSISLTVGDDR
jgi:hypothetical protein